MRSDLLLFVRFVGVLAAVAVLAAIWFTVAPKGQATHSEQTSIKTPGYKLPALPIFQQETTGARNPE